jgi:hypothetical protein
MLSTARTINLRTPVTASHQRFGNKSNSRKTEKVEGAKIAAPETNPPYAAHEPVSPPAPVSRAHLRVVQNRRGSKYG